jgi:hypothetical protein
MLHTNNKVLSARQNRGRLSSLFLHPAAVPLFWGRLLVKLTKSRARGRKPTSPAASIRPKSEIEDVFIS